GSSFGPRRGAGTPAETLIQELTMDLRRRTLAVRRSNVLITLTEPQWTHCALGADPVGGDPIGCWGQVVEPYSACLSHLAEHEVDAYVAGLRPGSDLKHTGTALTQRILDRLLDAVRNPATGRPEIGLARFDYVTFPEGVSFERATFETAVFNGAKFNGRARFVGVKFGNRTQFASAEFGSEADFTSVSFGRGAFFNGSHFRSHVTFTSVTARGDVGFSGVQFEVAGHVGPVACSGKIDFSFSTFSAPIAFEIAAKEADFRRARWLSTATLRLRYADVDLTSAVFEYPLRVIKNPRPFVAVLVPGPDEGDLGSLDPTVTLVSLQGVDAAHLVLADLDLSRCRFFGTVHLDQMRIEGETSFGYPPTKSHWAGWKPQRFYRRQVIAEEQYWRSSQTRAVSEWLPNPPNVEINNPSALAPIYRALRKSLEDTRNEPGAADFYYGEMEMRRADRTSRVADRVLVHIYWMLSGYGLRALRALAWLFLAVWATLASLMLWGLPDDDWEPKAVGAITSQNVTMSLEKPDVVNPSGALRDRISSERFEKSLRVVVNSVVFRSSGEDLATTGTYIEMVSRITEPLLLGLAVLAVRGRVKR
ncbi:pentapeptide repeat-containing protein, partial [Streptomyces atratus]|uniref:pentapeptide repeat-containing protein n=1 Tax=Streptomyces atratus TaxID=1893 RepID=UPI00365B01A7